MSASDAFTTLAQRLAPAGAPREPSEAFCYVALGDSFTAGTGCAPGEAWADRLAAALGSTRSPVGYCNLASDGATSTDVLEGQVGVALQLEPDLVTLVCGANDVLRSVRPDVDGYRARFAASLDRLCAGVPGARILTATSPETWRFLELRSRTRARVVRGIRAVNEATRTVARERGVPCLEVVGHPGLDEPENFSADGLHPSRRGHARAAVEFARAIESSFGLESSITREERA
jgi:lysophospholipase L1-like esterase